MITTQEQILMRQKRHQKLMKLIQEYNLTQEEARNLEKVKRNTELQIATRFIKSKQNRNYVFPLKKEQQEEEIQEFPAKMSFEHTFYDLNNQNYLSGRIVPNNKIESKIARRVKSLGSEKIDEKIQDQIAKSLRQRPQQRESNRQKLLFPPLISYSKSHRVLSKIQMKPMSSNSSPFKASKSGKKLIKIRENTTNQKSNKKIVQMVEAKLLTEGNNILTFGNRAIMLNSLKIMNIKQPLKIYKH